MDYPNSGALWTSTQKRNERAPDMNGDITIDKDLLMQLMEEAQGEPRVKIKLDGWKKKDKNGNAMVSIKVNTYKKPTNQQQNVRDPWDD